MGESGVYRGGSGKPLVLLHSGFSTWAEWRSLIALIADRRTVLAPTLPGSDGGGPLDLRGRTMIAAQADRVEQLLDDVGWDAPVDIAGSSAGGVCGLELATRGRAAGVTAFGPPWIAGAGAAFYGVLFASVLPGVRLTDAILPATLAPRMMGALLHGSPRSVEMTDIDAGAMWRSWGRFPLWRTGLSLARGGHLGPGMPDLARVDVPVRLVWGGGDRIVPGWMHARWRAALPAAEEITLSGMPHCPHLRDPERVAALL